MKSQLIRDNENCLILEDFGTLSIKNNYYISSESFIKYITKSGYQSNNYDELIKIEDLNSIAYIEMFNSKKQKYHLYLNNSMVHNNKDSAWTIGKVEYWYFNGIEYEYDEWLDLPERIREIRNEKLNIL